MMRRLPGEERGIALPMVVAIIAVISILGFTAAFLVDSQRTMGSRYSGREKALAVAEAGIYEYLWHLNKDSKFYEEDDEFILDDGEPRVHAFQDGFYQLSITDPDTVNPAVTITATGWPADDPDNRRTVEIQVHKRQFVQSIFVSGEEKTPVSGNSVYWITGDEVWGPMHTNGTLYINGNPVFHDRVTYSGSPPAVTSGSLPVYQFPDDPQQVAQLVFPSSNSQLKTFAKLGGYYYSGRTCILLNGNQVTIRDQSGAAATKSLPPNGVIYVDGTTSGSKWGLSTGNVFVSGTLDGRLTIAAANDIYITGKDPTNYNYSAATTTGGIKYSDTDFDLAGGITDDMLGLVAGRYVRILHHDWPSASSPYYVVIAPVNDVAPSDITVHAAIFALNWAFEYEDYANGSQKGEITMVGSLTQRYRGAVGTFNQDTRITGYLKKYTHDPRMSYDTPPHFLEPLNAGWEIRSWREAPNP